MGQIIGYLVSGAIIASTALVSVLIKWVFDKLRASKFLKNGETKTILLDTLEKLAEKGIAVANQRFVDKAKLDGLWKVSDAVSYESNCTKALDLAANTVEQFLSITERKQAISIFGQDNYQEVIKNVIDTKIRESKTTEV